MFATAERTPVEQAMHRGVISLAPQATMREIATAMYEHRVHCVVVDGLARGPRGDEQMVWGLVTDLELMRAAAGGRLDDEAGATAATEIVAIPPTDTVGHAAALMADHECTHLVVVDPRSGAPLGVISTLDVAATIAREEPGRTAST